MGKGDLSAAIRLPRVVRGTLGAGLPFGNFGPGRRRAGADHQSNGWKAKRRMFSRRAILVGFWALAWMAPVPAVAADAVRFETSELAVVTERGRFSFAVEMAVTETQRQRGLQHRNALAPDAGMLFDFEYSQPAAMWMKNTPVPLDMIFIAGDGRVVNVKARTQPDSLAVIRSAGAVRAVLEVNDGTAERLGIEAGSLILHPLFGTAAP